MPCPDAQPRMAATDSPSSIVSAAACRVSTPPIAFHFSGRRTTSAPPAALGWQAFALAGSSRLGIVLLGLAAGELATLLVGGALADRYERRRMMIVSDVWRFVVVGALAAVDATGHLTFPILVALAVVV